ncbi:DNA-binding response regulator [Propionigenium maris DSM 9537]|uniref:DNA-binding response regulator n=1 Tax=Propionigenium maris DSM 9537 TaxID=1123000 RepID=A0A9W6LMS5_9FUSO|nr:response regulator transcription factor [Propionigenium maris]GLI55205.1 DNA-binding response regulator [Propionigenium maris DSM 9537]
MKRILIVEDDKKLARVLELQLSYEGYRLDIARDGFEGLLKFREENYDLVLLDVMIPKIDGYEVCKRIKGESDVPIIMVTAKDDISDRIIGLDTGADDYVVKPFNYGELAARIRANLRKTSNDEEKIITYRDMVVDPKKRIVTRAGREIELSKQEFDLLEYLVINSGIAMSCEKILEKIWGDADYSNPNVLDVYIKYLRDKVDRGHEEKLIKTIRGVGYTIR